MESLHLFSNNRNVPPSAKWTWPSLARAIQLISSILLVVFGFLLGGNAKADDVLDFANKVMQMEVDYSRQFDHTSSSAIAFSKRDDKKNRWPNHDSAQLDRMKNISRDYLLNNNIQPTTGVNSFMFDGYKILGRRGSIVFVRQLMSDCLKFDCSDRLTLTLNIVKERDRYVLRPGKLPHAGEKLQYWWTNSSGPFQMPSDTFCTAPSQLITTQMQTTIDSLIPLMSAGAKKKYNRRQRLEPIAQQFFHDTGIEPALLDVGEIDVVRYSIVGIYGMYVDVEMQNCRDCNNFFLRFKTVVENGKLRVLPHKTTGSTQNVVSYDESRSWGPYMPLCESLSRTK